MCLYIRALADILSLSLVCALTCGKWPDFNKCSLPLSSSAYQTVKITASFQACGGQLEEPGRNLVPPLLLSGGTPLSGRSTPTPDTRKHTPTATSCLAQLLFPNLRCGAHLHVALNRKGKRTQPSRKRSRWHARADMDRFSRIRERTGEVRRGSCGNRQYQVGRAPSQLESG